MIWEPADVEWYIIFSSGKNGIVEDNVGMLIESEDITNGNVYSLLLLLREVISSSVYYPVEYMDIGVAESGSATILLTSNNTELACLGIRSLFAATVARPVFGVK